MHRPGLTSQKLLFILPSRLAAAFLLLALACSAAPQKTALHLDGTRADPFLTASGKPVVLIFVRTDCWISNRYCALIQRISPAYTGRPAVALVCPVSTSTPDE